MTQEINRAVFQAYKNEVYQVQELIKEDLPEEPGSGLDGREWCEEHSIPETVFVDAINWMKEAEYGVTPMYPWKIP